MVKARKINVVELNEIRSEDPTKATPEEAPEPIEDIVVPPEDEVVASTPAPLKEVEPSPVETKEIEVVNTKDAKATCAFCNKVMSVKALRYSHDKNCKGKQPVPVERTITTRTKSPERREEPYPRDKPRHPKDDEPPTPRNSLIERPQLVIPKAKPTKAEVRQQRLNNLISQAF